MTERGLSVDHGTIWRWVQRYAPVLNQRLRREQRHPNGFWRVDETYVRVAGNWTYLYRADSTGATIDFMLSPKRDLMAAKLFLRLNDWVVRYENRLLQVERQNRNWAPARAKVTVCEWQDGSIDIHYGERKLSWTEIEARAVKPAIQSAAKALTHRKPEPAKDHPWRKSYQTMRTPKRSPEGISIV
jgi:hypothetical protein